MIWINFIYLAALSFIISFKNLGKKIAVLIYEKAMKTRFPEIKQASGDIGDVKDSENVGEVYAMHQVWH